MLVDAEHLSRDNRRWRAAEGGEAADAAGVPRRSRLQSRARARPRAGPAARRRVAGSPSTSNVLITGATGRRQDLPRLRARPAGLSPGLSRALPPPAAALRRARRWRTPTARYTTLLARLARVDVLVLDDWGLARRDGRAPPRPARDARGPRRQPLDHHHQPAPARAVARLPRRPHRRRRDPRSAGPSGASDRSPDLTTERAPSRRRDGGRSNDRVGGAGAIGTASEQPDGRGRPPEMTPMETPERFPQGLGKLAQNASFPHRPPAIIVCAVDGRTKTRRTGLACVGRPRLVHCQRLKRRFAPITMRGPTDHDDVDAVITMPRTN